MDESHLYGAGYVRPVDAVDENGNPLYEIIYIAVGRNSDEMRVQYSFKMFVNYLLLNMGYKDQYIDKLIGKMSWNKRSFEKNRIDHIKHKAELRDRLLKKLRQ